MAKNDEDCTERSNNASFDDLLLAVRKAQKDVREFVALLIQQPVQSRLEKLRSTAEKIGSKVARRPPPLERYIQQWNQFLAGKREELDRGTARYLCWEPDVATSYQFLRYLEKSELELNRRPLEGLVRSCHSRWQPPGQCVAVVRKLLEQYQGKNPILLQWKRNAESILGSDGPTLLARGFLRQGKSLETYLDDWHLEPHSPFVQDMVKSAAAGCREDLSTVSTVYTFLFKEVLPWQGWKLSDFKKEIGNIILHKAADKSNIQEALQSFVLGHKELGDPRLPANRRKWAEVPPEAKRRMLGWLCREDIFFFFDHAFPASTDRHHRKEFWLQYLGQCTASRPLLGSNDARRLRIMLQRDKTRVAHFGSLRSTYASAFLLEFGDITVVEFSVVGACYIYKSDVFSKIVPDFWAKDYFSEVGLKDYRCIASIRHRVDWQRGARAVLAENGLRPGGFVR